MQNLRLLELLESVLGPARKKSKGNHGFTCPFPDCKHDSYKLEIDLTGNTHRWHCWRCDRKGTLLQYLFKQINASPNKIEELNKLTKYHQPEAAAPKQSTAVFLPKEYLPLWTKHPSFEYKNAIHYALRKRKLTPGDIIKHEVGYCESGEYSGKLIFPSYDEYGSLNFFTARAYYPDVEYPHKNPSVSKNIIGFELFVNWNLPVTIVEGPLDAITVRQNAIPLFGKNILSTLRKKLKTTPGVYMALDPDALKKSIYIVEELMAEGIDVFLMDLGGDDPNKMGFDLFHKIKDNTKKMTFSSLIKYKMLLGKI